MSQGSRPAKCLTPLGCDPKWPPQFRRNQILSSERRYPLRRRSEVNYVVNDDVPLVLQRSARKRTRVDLGLGEANIDAIRSRSTEKSPSRAAKIERLSKFASSITLHPPDGVLIVGPKRIQIHKTYLSYYSEYFETMFRSKQDEIVLEVEYEEMIELLAVIYPSHAPITAQNLKTILKLAERFLMPDILDRCKKELRNSTLNGIQKLLLAQMYGFADLQMEFAQQYKSAEDAKKLKSEPQYNELDHKTRALLFDSIDF